MTDAREHDPIAAAAMIKEIHATAPIALDEQQVLFLISRPMNLGRGLPPKRPPGKRGRPSARTAYDLAFGRRRGLYQRLVANKVRRLGKGYHEPADLQAVIAELIRERVHPRRLVSTAIRRLQLAGRPVPDESTIRKWRRNGLIKFE